MFKSLSRLTETLNHVPVLSCPLRRPWKLAVREATTQSTLRIWWLQLFENRSTEYKDRRGRRAVSHFLLILID